MTEGKARDFVTASAFVTGAIYLYRKLVEPAVGGASVSAERESTGPTTRTAALDSAPTDVAGQAAQLLGKGEVAPVSRFVVGWGFTYICLSLAVEVDPDLAGAFAGLVAVGAVLGNGVQVSADIQAQLVQREKAERAGTSGADSTASPSTLDVSWITAGSTSAEPSTSITPETTPRRRSKGKKPTKRRPFKTRSA